MLHAPDRTRLLSVTALPPVRPGHVVVEVVGEVDTYTAPLLDACLTTQTRRRGVATLTVDMRRVTFLGAAGVCVLAQTQRRCRVRGVRLAIVPDGQGRVLRPIWLCRLDDVLPRGPAVAAPAGSRVVREPRRPGAASSEPVRGAARAAPEEIVPMRGGNRPPLSLADGRQLLHLAAEHRPHGAWSTQTRGRTVGFPRPTTAGGSDP